jgi:hypothetical protein
VVAFLLVLCAGFPFLPTFAQVQTKLVLATRKESPGFLAGNRDALIVGSLLVIATALVTHYIELALKQLESK